MMYMECWRVTYGGADILRTSDAPHSYSMRISIKIERDDCEMKMPTSTKPGGINFNSIFVIGRAHITFTAKNSNPMELGVFDIPSTGGWRKGFCIDFPLLPEIRDLFLRKGAGDGLLIRFEHPGVILGILGTDGLFASYVLFISSQVKVLHPKATDEEDTRIILENDVLEKIAQIDLAQSEAKRKTHSVLQETIKALHVGEVEKAVISLRNLLMNVLTEKEPTKKTGEQRVIKKKIIEARLSGYEGQARANLEELISSKIEKIIDLNLDILHKYVKDDKFQQIPDYATVAYVYGNILNLIRYFDLGDE